MPFSSQSILLWPRPKSQVSSQPTLKISLEKFGSNSSQWFSVNGASSSSLDQYRAASGDTTSIAGKRNYIDSSRTIETYLASQGYATDMNSFAALLCQQSKFNWVPALKATSINDYIRAGFATH